MLRSTRPSTAEPAGIVRPSVVEGMALILWGCLVIGYTLTPGSPLGAALTMGFVVVAPGLAGVRLLGIRGIARWLLAVAGSLAVSTLLAEAMASAAVWVPQLAIIGLALVTIALAGVPHVATWLDVVSEVPPPAAPSVGAARVHAALRALEIVPAPSRINVPVVEPPPDPARTMSAPRRRRRQALIAELGWELPAKTRVRTVPVLGTVHRLANGTIGPAVPSATRRVRLAADAIAEALLADDRSPVNAAAILGLDGRAAEILAIAVSQSLAVRTREPVHLVQIDSATAGVPGGKLAPSGLETGVLMYEYVPSRRPLPLERHAVRTHTTALSEQGEWLVAHGSLDGAAAEVWLPVTAMAVVMGDRRQTEALSEVARHLWNLGAAQVAAVLIAPARSLRQRIADAGAILGGSPTQPDPADAEERVSTLAWVGHTLLPAPPGGVRTRRPTPAMRPQMGTRRGARE